MTPQELQNQINRLKADLQALNDEVYKSNYSTHQDFTKYSNFASRLKVPYYATAPATCEAGELIEVGGKLYIASATNTWALVGGQTA